MLTDEFDMVLNISSNPGPIGYTGRLLEGGGRRCRQEPQPRRLSAAGIDLNRAEAWFDRRAAPAVLVCRCIPLMRSLISIPAGFRRMPLIPFTLYTAIGSLILNVVLVGAGNFLGVNWRLAGRPVELLQGAVRRAPCARHGRGLVCLAETDHNASGKTPPR